VGPDDARTKLPKGVKRIKSKYNRVWVIERIYADDGSPKDIREVRKIQDKITVTPLSKYGQKGWQPREPRRPDTTVEDPPLPSGMAYYDKLGALLERYPPPANNQPELDKLAAIGVGPGKTPSKDPSLSADTVKGMIAAGAAGRDSVLADVRAQYLAGFAAHNGYLVPATGTYGTDYRFRAEVTQVGLGALTPEQAIYPLAQVDRSLSPLTGAKQYTMHIPKGQLPPVKAFWSLTLYDLDGFLVANPIDRYLINDRSDLHYSKDGSLDLYIQSTRPVDPKKARNWLPSPAGKSFRLIWRLYATKPNKIAGVLSGSGWTPPAITPAP
jgi:hypothetical protein